jgi:hypothetical protein
MGQRARLAERAGRLVERVERREPDLDDGSTKRWGRCRQHDGALEGSFQGLALGDDVCVEIVREVGEQHCDGLRAGVAEQHERRDEIRSVDHADAAVDAASAVLALEDRDEDLVEERLGGRCLERPSRELQRRGEERGPGEAAATLVGLGQARQQPGHRDGRVADVEDLRRRVREVDLDLVHLAERRRRDGKEAVEDERILPRLGEQDEATARRSCKRALGHEGRERRRERGVDARAALAERPRARLGRVPVPGRDRAAHGESLRPR